PVGRDDRLRRAPDQRYPREDLVVPGEYSGRVRLPGAEHHDERGVLTSPRPHRRFATGPAGVGVCAPTDRKPPSPGVHPPSFRYCASFLKDELSTTRKPLLPA